MKIYTYQEANTAGPSLNENNMRLELFLVGCKKFLKKPCKGCFNSIINNPNNHLDKVDIPANLRAEEYLSMVESNHTYRFLTISGGEPLDQIKELIEFTKTIKASNPNVHIMSYTWHDINKILNEEDEGLDINVSKKDLKELMLYVDAFVDGEFILEENIYNYRENEEIENKFNFVGSSNQKLWIKNNKDNTFKATSFKEIKEVTFDEQTNNYTITRKRDDNSES